MRSVQTRTVRLMLVLALMVSTQGLLVVQGAFVLRQEFIAEKLCLNRERPDIECEGTCVLKSLLKEQREREEQQHARLEIALSISIIAHPSVELPMPTTRATAWPTHIPVRLVEADSGDIFHPPRS